MYINVYEGTLYCIGNFDLNRDKLKFQYTLYIRRRKFENCFY